MSSLRPVSLVLHRVSRVLEVEFEDGSRFRLPFEYLRVHSPSAEVQGHHPDQRVVVAGKREVGIRAVEPVGHYGVRLCFDDGHDTGIYTWDILHRLGREQERNWPRYLAELEARGLSR
ncbi:MAG: hypothetical protein KatS3mg126_1713 [Lysobacteraceae bacterium]|nr:MAG: hypothetical protein KatS3mg126_1713 [Xanthomonadaceae bacterium]